MRTTFTEQLAPEEASLSHMPATLTAWRRQAKRTLQRSTRLSPTTTGSQDAGLFIYRGLGDHALLAQCHRFWQV